MKYILRQADRVLKYLIDQDDELLECSVIEKNLRIDRRDAILVYDLLKSDELISDRSSEEKGISHVYLQPKGRSFIIKTSYAREQWKDWPLKNWLLADAFKYLVGAIIGAGITLIVSILR